MIKKWEKGALYMVASSLFLSLLAFFVKEGIKEISVVQMTFLRYAAPLLLSLPYLLFTGFFAKLHFTASLTTHVLRSLAAVCSQWAMNYYLTEASILNAVMLWCTGPLFVPLLARIFYKQKSANITWVTLVISFIGVAFIIKPTTGVFDPFSIWGLLSGVATAFSQILWGKNAETGRVSENLFYLYFFASILSLIPLLALGGGSWYVVPMDRLVLYTIIGLAIGSIGNQLLRSKAYKESSPALLSPILYVSVIGSGVLDWLYYKHLPDIWVYIGFTLVLLGALLKWWVLRRQLMPR